MTSFVVPDASLAPLRCARFQGGPESLPRVRVEGLAVTPVGKALCALQTLAHLLPYSPWPIRGPHRGTTKEVLGTAEVLGLPSSVPRIPRIS